MEVVHRARYVGRSTKLPCPLSLGARHPSCISMGSPTQNFCKNGLCRSNQAKMEVILDSGEPYILGFGLLVSREEDTQGHTEKAL